MENNKIHFKIQKKDPKPNAKQYHIETVQDVFDATNIDNVDKFLDEFKMVLCSGYLLRDVSKNENPDEKVGLPSFIWIDD